MDTRLLEVLACPSCKGPLERAERLEQLRALEQGWAIAIAVAHEAPGPGVDTEADLRRVEALLSAP